MFWTLNSFIYFIAIPYKKKINDFIIRGSLNPIKRKCFAGVRIFITNYQLLNFEGESMELNI